MVKKLLFLFTLLILFFGAKASYQYRPVHTLVDLYDINVDERERRAFNREMNQFARLLTSDASQSLLMIDSLLMSDDFSPESKQVFSYFRAKAMSGLSQFDEAKDYLAILMSNSLNESLLADCWVLKARLLKYTGDYANSIEAFREALKVYQLTKDNVGLVILYVNLGEYYRAIGNFELALEYLYGADKLSSASNVTMELELYKFSRKAAVFNESNQLDSALITTRKYLDLSKKTGNKVLMAEAYNELASVLARMGDDAEIEGLLLTAIDLWKEAGYDRYWVSAAGNLCSHWIEMRQFDKASQLINEVMPVIRKYQWYSVLYTYYEHLATISLLSNDIKLAYRYLDSAKAAVSLERSTLVNKEVAVRTANLEVERKKLELQVELTRAERERQKFNLILIALVTAGALLVVVLIFYLSLKSKNKQINRINGQLSEAVTNKEQLLKDVHHRVKNNLSFLIGLIQLQKSQSSNEEAKVELDKVKERLESMAMLHASLLSRGNLEGVDLNYLISEIKMQIENITSNVSVNVNSLLKPIVIPGDKAVLLGVIINELVTNAIKHSLLPINGGTVDIGVSLNEGKLCLKIADSAVDVSKMLDFSNPQTVGLKLIKMLVNQLRGTITYDGISDSIYLSINYPLQ